LASHHDLLHTGMNRTVYDVGAGWRPNEIPERLVPPASRYVPNNSGSAHSTSNGRYFRLACQTNLSTAQVQRSDPPTGAKADQLCGGGASRRTGETVFQRDLVHRR
jgi:hypothetical protein